MYYFFLFYLAVLYQKRPSFSWDTSRYAVVVVVQYLNTV